MSDPKLIAERFAAELKQADLDHHKPTAGAMTGHILSNFYVFDMKLHQFKWFVKGPNSLSLSDFFGEMITTNRQNIDELGELLLDENEIAPSTFKEVLEYAKLNEDGSYKYLDADEMVAQIASDLVTQDLFIDRAIKLSQRENRVGLAQFLIELRRQNNRYQKKLQAILNKTSWEDLVEVDDDED